MSSNQMFSHHELLKNTLVSDIIQKIPLISFRPETKLSECLKTFKNEAIFSAPIFDNSTNEFIGMVDIFSILSFLLSKDEDFSTEGFRKKLDLSCSVLPKQKVCLMEPTESVLTFLHLHSIHKCQETLVHLARQFTFELSYCVIVELDIIKFLAQHINRLGIIGSQSLEELHLFEFNQRQKMVLLKLDQPLIEGLKKMIASKVRVAGLLAEDGTLVGTLSETDFVLHIDELLHHGFDKLQEPISKFFGEKKPFVPITCEKDDNLVTAITKAAGSSVHQIWIVDSQQKPLGLVSIFEILDVLSQDNVATPSLSMEKELLQKSLHQSEQNQRAKVQA